MRGENRQYPLASCYGHGTASGATLGVAVPMRPGDFLLFNARLPHCISSRCCADDDIMCISMFLKTAVVGGNDNGKDLNGTQ